MPQQDDPKRQDPNRQPEQNQPQRPGQPGPDRAPKQFPPGADVEREKRDRQQGDQNQQGR